MRVIFCGNPSFAVPTLQALLTSSHDVVAAVCSPDKPRGRGQKLEPLPVKQVALSAAVPVLQPESLRDESFLEYVREFKPDCLVVVAFRILPRELFALPRLGSFNVHPSLLPSGRGPEPIRWSLIRGESDTGVTIIQLNERVDAGAMLRQERTEIHPEEDFGSLHDRLAVLGAKLLVEVLDRCARGEAVTPLTQDESRMTKAPKLTSADRILSWRQTASDVVNRVRALCPSPGAFAVAGDFRLNVLKAEMLSAAPSLAPGEISVDKTALTVGTSDAAVRLMLVQPEGRRPMAVADYLRGRPELPPMFDT